MHHKRVEFEPMTGNSLELDRPGIPYSWRNVRVLLQLLATIEPVDLFKHRALDSIDRTPRQTQWDGLLLTSTALKCQTGIDQSSQRQGGVQDEDYACRC
jgi:hypothetical protein